MCCTYENGKKKKREKGSIERSSSHWLVLIVCMSDEKDDERDEGSVVIVLVFVFAWGKGKGKRDREREGKGRGS